MSVSSNYVATPRVSASSVVRPSGWKKLRRLFFSTLVWFVVASIASVLAFRWLPVPTSAFMLYRHFEDASDQKTFKPIRYEWVSYAEISPYASKAVIASEDQKFYRHRGFDVEAMKKAMLNNEKGKKVRGASTISQQVAKNLFLIPARSYVRKGVEAWFTFLIERFWTKERILEVYLNIAEFGDHLFGINEASYKYFSVPPNQLKPAQAALLAATLPNPLIYRANRPSTYVFKRQQWILRQMRNLG
jgi:monofunctional biosynthetic peptidoglycan transglycosylase